MAQPQEPPLGSTGLAPSGWRKECPRVVLNSNGVTPRGQVSMLPSSCEPEHSPVLHRDTVPELRRPFGSYRMDSLSQGTLNTARSFAHEAHLNQSAENRFAERRRRRTSLPTVSEFSEAPASPMLTSTLSSQRLTHPPEMNGASQFIPAPPGPAQPIARGPRVHTPLPATLLQSLGGHSSGWLTRRSHLRNCSGFRELFPDSAGPSADLMWSGGSPSPRKIAQPNSSRLTQQSSSLGLLDNEHVTHHREPVAGRRARPQGVPGAPCPMPPPAVPMTIPFDIAPAVPQFDGTHS